MTATLEATIRSVADQLLEARRLGTPIAAVRGHLPPKDVAAAYAVQKINIDRLLAEGRRRVGRKIGLTSEAVQRQLGVDAPDFGVLLNHMDFSAGVIPLKGLIAPRIEAEFALRLARDITEPGLSGAALASFVEAVAVSAEIVDSATKWDIDIVDTIADNASSCGFAVGEWRPYGADSKLPERTMRLLCDGEVISRGTGAATLGDPLNALAWLADASIEVGEPLRAGEIILSGALGPMVSLTAAEYRVEIDGFDPLVLRAVA
ncbi:MAG: 2-keto-4-pentenoate hydratase [Phenylobacterium sp.]|uniref:2-keto-4-pentenoate hydratase n=1 Tax=Phenylobacterium sp. TaxID=1871053 RepID=UPI0025E8775B|nr:fumarylacetoacetate hydrolase family protein [Phenylobacterium sp.]MBA4013730.1 2-keto-4-pentenoate hydratase [Phenylobacterium sp.]